jgi:hypothetical protein
MPTNSFAILASVPVIHLLSANKTITAFGSDNPELFQRADEIRGEQSVKVLIYASQSGGRPLNPQVSWHGLYIHHVDSENGRYPGNRDPKFRPPSTADDTAWKIFWEVQDLQRLDTPIRIDSLVGLGNQESYNSNFFPRGPLLIEYPFK